MSVKFNDIMKNFYNDEKLGIKNEDAPANATGVAVAGTGDDNSVVVVKMIRRFIKRLLVRKIILETRR